MGMISGWLPVIALFGVVPGLWWFVHSMRRRIREGLRPPSAAFVVGLLPGVLFAVVFAVGVTMAVIWRFDSNYCLYQSGLDWVSLDMRFSWWPFGYGCEGKLMRGEAFAIPPGGKRKELLAILWIPIAGALALYAEQWRRFLKG